MRTLLLTPNQQWTDDVADAVCYKDRACHGALLRCAADVGHGYDDCLANDCAKCTDYGVSGYGSGRMVRPGGFPDHGAACDDGEAVDDEENDPYVGYTRGEIAAKKDRNEADETKRELPEYRCQGRPAECVYDEWAETRNCAVDGVR